MWDPFKQDVQSVLVKNEARRTSDGEIPHPELSSEKEEDDIHYLKGELFFDVILAKSHVSPRNQLFMPTHMVPFLPRATVPVVLSHGGKNWNLSYNGDYTAPKFDPQWKIFVAENHLKIGDACVFELMENCGTNLRFKVHILRPGDMPAELLELIKSRGQTIEAPICID